MGPLEKLQLLAQAAAYEPAEDVGLTGTRFPTAAAPAEMLGCIHYAATPKGRIPLLKTLVSSACERDCTYCPFRSGRDFRRETFTPDDLAGLFLQLYRADLVQGIFLSSGLVGGGPRTQDRIIDTATLLRKRYGFSGYMHLKVMPGAERDQVAATMALADRVSVNLEGPNARRLSFLAPHKHFSEELVQRLQWIHELREAQGGRGPSTTTQFVVGAAGESDAELLLTTEFFYRRQRMARAYFSSFHPVSDTPLEGLPPSSPEREMRLYQASFLLRDYGFTAEELPFDTKGNLPLKEDPKVAWAQEHLSQTPVELNHAPREQLLRVPGVGIKGVEQILEARRKGTLCDLSQLRKLGLPVQRVAPYILLDGKQPARQLQLWAVG
ncbi:MAG: radical SAM protein [Anaerolineae bacterium]|jgi:predicted DNA-binding helix-hairpin-helix protein|nr:radical SAM protein [Anaerolineae bacterium]